MCASARERSFSTNPCSPANPSPIEVGRPRYLGPVDLSPARAGAGHCGTGSAFVPQIALLIAAATGNRRVLASGRNLEVIPVTLGVSSWKVSRQRLRPASCSSLPISRISTRQRPCRLVKPGRPRRPHLMKWSRDRDACFLILGNLQMLPTRTCSSKMSRNTTLFPPESFSNPPSTSWL